jgi:hypothetical protein
MSVAIQSTNIPTFAPFLRLPKELRLTIWRLATEIEPIIVRLDVPYLNAAPFLLEREDAGPDIQARRHLMQVSETCKEALSFIQDSFIPIIVMWNRPGVQRQNSTTLFDVSNDMIFATFDTVSDIVSFTTRFPKLAQRMKRLALPVDHQERKEDGLEFLGALRALGSLKEVCLVWHFLQPAGIRYGDNQYHEYRSAPTWGFEQLEPWTIPRDFDEVVDALKAKWPEWRLPAFSIMNTWPEL